MAHFWHPFADMASVSAYGELVLVRGDGVRVWDESGRRYLDATAGLWFANVGFGRKDIADAAAAQMAALPAYSTFGDFSNRPASELAERVVVPRTRHRQPRVPHERRFRLDRHRDEDGAAVLAARGTARANDPDPPGACVPRDAHRGDEPGRASPQTRPATES